MRCRRGSAAWTGPARPPRGRQTPSLPPSRPAWPGPTSEAELHLPLAAARQPGEAPDADAERHGAGEGQRCPARPGVTQPRLAQPVRPPAPRPGASRAWQPPPKDTGERGGQPRLLRLPQPWGTGLALGRGWPLQGD